MVRTPLPTDLSPDAGAPGDDRIWYRCLLWICGLAGGAVVWVTRPIVLAIGLSIEAQRTRFE
jgi:hypothetical protein